MRAFLRTAVARLSRSPAGPRLALPGVAAILLAAAGSLGFAGSPSPIQRSAAQDTLRFDHARHESLACTTCHNPRDPRRVRTWNVTNDCMGCHHGDTPTGRECARCHTASELAPSRPVATSVALSVWNAPRSRELGFSHERHALDCGTCHAQTRERTLEKTCTSCHADHHTAARDCSSCHPSPRATHTREVHAAGCATAGCHVREQTAAVTPVRSTCLVCHAEERGHKPGRECATCHLSNWPAAARTGGR
jgi:hypothetical protein